MRFPEPRTLADLAEWLNCTFVGHPDHEITGINEIHVVETGDLVFVDHPKYYDKALNSAATTILINKEVEAPEGKGLLVSDDPFRDFNRITRFYKPFQAASKSIADDLIVGEGTIIQPGTFIGKNVVIGKDCVIHANVTIYGDCTIGDRVTIHAGTVLGSSAFYYKKRPEGYDPLVSGGDIRLEDDVELGASCTIDRGVSGTTIIGKGSKLDNNVHIGHDTQIGQNCLFASQVGVAGCVIVEDNVTLWGQVGVTSGITLGKGCVVLAQSGISKSLEGGKTYFGYPAEDARKKYREMASLRILPEIIEKLG
ncbi:UDP-3-O-(3-hydroxymyristoyl)glucosamine N-acyltransferase [Phaeocystidibacter marisrubri]|uniref:UDP-3-O-(3-hydroxymyristoyl)glucosamine N-acyltransferase n=1 Tax=Phaeocystidibacter marisrubri TaxID=1577780 RepID=A0A6L3ZEX8_9FLAO|nr:UDP-3-O-(3-hydroxymyristoyl)glucosamine N-acyltransferase [Phaeocystidibacter marisrubri]KAB2815962.1 UDP-3-O-(3-hydroxymyristoyl)glucosamine N-acyltransferase [Phaeocystidibacter marisrubri]GGH66611.1 UDP-3-O-(3-hydroxymyristoyl)glucosamine N-acyltransferase [Phaeocystidibacter marisrubri]